MEKEEVSYINIGTKNNPVKVRNRFLHWNYSLEKNISKIFTKIDRYIVKN